MEEVVFQRVSEHVSTILASNERGVDLARFP